MDFEREVNLTDLLTLLLTVALTVYVVVWGEKRFGEDRAEKDLLIDAIGGAREALGEVAGLFKETYQERALPDQRTMLAALEDLGYTLGDLKGLAEDAGHDRAVQVVASLLEGDYIRIRRALTGGTSPPSHTWSRPTWRRSWHSPWPTLPCESWCLR